VAINVLIMRVNTLIIPLVTTFHPWALCCGFYLFTYSRESWIF
jgi:hypothetical protein